MRLDFFLHFDTHNLVVFSESGWPKVPELLMELLRMPEAATEVSFFQVLPTCWLRPLQCTEKCGERAAVPLPPLPTPSSPAAHRPQPRPREGKATPHLSSLLSLHQPGGRRRGTRDVSSAAAVHTEQEGPSPVSPWVSS